LVEPGVNGFLIETRDPSVWADAVEVTLDLEHSTAMSTSAVLLARSYTWKKAAESLVELTERLALSGLLRC
jgi:glycosyltransferase involved in cell wall biosynthesis